MILICGIPSEPPIANAIEALSRRDASFVVFNQRDATESSAWHRLDRNGYSGELRVRNISYDLASVGASYARMVEPSQLPEVRTDLANGARAARAQAVHDVLMRFLEVGPGLPVNRYSAMASNASKTYQAQLIMAAGFRVPETIVTNDPDEVRAFAENWDAVVFKSVSGTRSIVRTLGAADRDRLDQIRWCPTQFQERVGGEDVRVHVIGERTVAVRVRSPAVDYRYASRDGVSCELEPMALPDSLHRQCVDLARQLGLAFAGIDLRLSPDGVVYCFEVNPSPGYTFYEERAGVPISEALADLLLEADRKRST